MTIKKVAYQVHLWLGLVSGIIVFMVCLTGAVWALKLNGWVDTPHISLPSGAHNSVPLSPSVLMHHVHRAIGKGTPTFLSYAKGRPAEVSCNTGKGFVNVLLHPYTGQIIAVKPMDGFNFWNFVRAGHTSLWLPPGIGHAVVGYATLIFVVILLTGLVLWWPRSLKGLKNGLRWKWRKQTKLPRKIYDLHNVPGFYVTPVLLVVALTGMVWALPWWGNGIYKLASGGKEQPGWQMAVSDTTRTFSALLPISHSVDELFHHAHKAYPQAEGFMISLPDSADKGSAFMIAVLPENDVFYNVTRRAYDQHTLRAIPMNNPYYGSYAEKDLADRLLRLNYDLHVGGAFGQTGRVLVFLASLFGMTLPLTGFYLYYKKWKKHRHKE